MKIEEHHGVIEPANGAYGWAVGASDKDIVGMPLLARAAAEHRGALTGVTILYINHAISDALMVARALSVAGATLVNVLVPYRGVEDRGHQALRRAFDSLGKTYAPPPQHPSLFASEMAATVATAIEYAAETAAAAGTRWMIVEDGGYAFPALHDRNDLAPYLTHCLGAVEHTTRGRWNYECLETDAAPRTPRVLRRPAVTVSGSRLKTSHEAGYIAQALVDECNWLLRRDHQFLRARKALVVGYGRVGRALAQALMRLGVGITVHDTASANTCDGLTRGDLVSAIEDGVFLVFGATGTSSFNNAALEAFVRRSPSSILYLASASSKAVEFSEAISRLEQAVADKTIAAELAGPGGTVVSNLDPEVGLRYSITIRGSAGERTKTLVLLGNGYPVIFYPAQTHGAPNRAMDPVMTQLYLAAVGLPMASVNLVPRVYDVNALKGMPTESLPVAWKTLVDEESLLSRWCEANEIEWSAYRQEIGFES